MAFNYHLVQTDFQPNLNNYCGGFALDAILFNLNVHAPQPIITYNGIQACQIGLGPNSQALVNASILGGTRISLPSSIAIFASQIMRTVGVFVNTQLVNTVVGFANVLPEERMRIQNNILYEDFHGYNPTLQNVLEDPNIDYTFFVVLVGDGGHWVAVKKEEGRYCMYDPADGSEIPFVFDEGGNNLPNNYTWNGVAIGIG